MQADTEEKGRLRQETLAEYDTLLSGLSLLHEDEQLHLVPPCPFCLSKKGRLRLVQVYSLAIESLTSSADAKLLADALHHRWLSDPSFPPVAAKLALFFADRELGQDELKFGSRVLALVMNDWRDRLAIRTSSHTVFANSAYFAFHFYFAFRHRDPIFKVSTGPPFCLICGIQEWRRFQSLVEPLFDYLHLLVDKNAGGSIRQLLANR